MNFYRKDWILYQEIANEGGKTPTELIQIKIKEDDVETNKHVPFIEKIEGGYKVKVGKNAYHSTDNEHHTIFIDLSVDDKFYYRQYIKTSEMPEAIFNVSHGSKVEAYAFCNLHGMFKNTL